MASISHAVLKAAQRTAALALNLAIYARYSRALWSFFMTFGRLPNIALPTTYNEKMFWRRVFDRNPAFVTCCDKLAARQMVGVRAPHLSMAEILWEGDDPADMPADLHRPDVVVKLNAGTGRNWFFGHAARKVSEFVPTVRRWLKRPHPRRRGEWAYEHIARKIFAERLVAPVGEPLDEYKVHVFGGQVLFTVVYRFEKTPHSQSAIFDITGQRLAAATSNAIDDPRRAIPADYRLPDTYTQALHFARAVAQGFDYLRVDFMHVGGRLYGGELTVYPTAGLMTISDPGLMAQMGQRWDLRQSWFLSSAQSGWRRAYQRLLWAHVASMPDAAVLDVRSEASAA